MLPLLRGAWRRLWHTAKEGSSSFLQKRTKKLLLIGARVASTRASRGKSFCVFFQKAVLSCFGSANVSAARFTSHAFRYGLY
jgi:hypothetical protein